MFSKYFEVSKEWSRTRADSRVSAIDKPHLNLKHGFSLKNLGRLLILCGTMFIWTSFENNFEKSI